MSTRYIYLYSIFHIQIARYVKSDEKKSLSSLNDLKK